MPNNLILDVSAINSAISRINAIESKLDTTHARIADKLATFTSIHAGSHPQVKIFAKTYYSAPKSIFHASNTKDGHATMSGTIDFKLGFQNEPVVLVSLGNVNNQHLVVTLKKVNGTADSITIEIEKMGTKDQKKTTWGANDKNFDIHVFAIGT